MLVAFAEADHAQRVRSLTPQQRADLLIDTLGRYFGPKATDPVEILELDWSEEPWTRGCYGAHLGAGVWTRYGSGLAEPVGRIHSAGTETAREWNGYMDGAVRSGRRVAEEILST